MLDSAVTTSVGGKSDKKGELMRKPALLLISLSSATLLLSAPSWQKKDFSQWTADDAKKILSDSPWAKTVQVVTGKMTAMRMGDGASKTASSANEDRSSPVNMASSERRYLVSPAPDGYAPNGAQMNGSAGGGQSQQPQGGGVPQSGGTPGMGQPGQGPQAGAQPAAPQTTPVVVEWESAVPVRLAELKLKSGERQPSQADVEQAKKPVDSYMVALIGVPGAPKQGEEQEMAAGATITAKGKQPIQATSVKEQTMTGGTRAIIFTFPKTQPITDEDKSVQFQEKKGALPTDVKQSFKLKDMHYDGKLTL